MLILSIPKSEPAGSCRINGQPAEYRVGPDFLEFRYEGEEAWDRRGILEVIANGTLVQYFCDDGPASEGPYCVIQPVAARKSDEQFYWLAINGASVAASSIPLPVTVRVSPTPEQLIGFRSREEQVAAQQFFLNAPIKEVSRYMNEELLDKIKSGEVAYTKPDKPEPPTTGATLWQLDSTDTR